MTSPRLLIWTGGQCDECRKGYAGAPKGYVSVPKGYNYGHEQEILGITSLCCRFWFGTTVIMEIYLSLHPARLPRQNSDTVLPEGGEVHSSIFTYIFNWYELSYRVAPFHASIDFHDRNSTLNYDLWKHCGLHVDDFHDHS